MDTLMAKKYFIPALLDIAKKYEFDILQNNQEDDNNIIITLHNKKLQKDNEGDFYHIEMWRFGIEANPPYRIRIVLFRGDDSFALSPDIVNEIDVKTLYHIVSYLDDKFCKPY